MHRFDHIRTQEDMEKPIEKGGMSMGGGRRLPGRSGQGCPGSTDGSHDMLAVSCVQSVEHFVCQNPGCDYHWYD